MTETTKEERFQKFINDAIASRPVEARLVRKVVKALKEAGTPVTSVWDGEEETPVTTTRSVLEVVFNLDDAYLQTDSGAWVRLVMGEGYDVICDYSVSLEEALKPVFDYIDKHDA